MSASFRSSSSIRRRAKRTPLRPSRYRRHKRSFWSIQDTISAMVLVFALTLAWLNRDHLATIVSVPLMPAALTAPVIQEWSDTPQALAPTAITASFGLCHSGGGRNCVVDGDTVWIDGEKVRIADIDTPETHPPRCAREAELGQRATLRLRDLLNDGPIALADAAGSEPHDRYGRRLAIIERGGRSIGMMLVSEGLARPYEGGVRAPWC